MVTQKSNSRRRVVDKGSQGGVSLPGTIGAVPVERNIDVEGGLSSNSPLVYFFGHVTPSENAKLYRTLVTRLADMVSKRLQRDPKSRSGGVIINTCGWVDGLGYRLLLHSIEVFNPDVVLVVGHDRLYNDLQKDVAQSKPQPKKSKVTILKVPKSGGVCTAV